MIMRKINKIIIHCSATPEGRHHTAKDIDSWHRAQGWKGIGYHYVILLDGTVETGRPESEIGAHTTGHNSDSIGICYIGGVNQEMNPKDTRTAEQRESMRKLVRELLLKYPLATIHGHREFANKACPSFDVAELIHDL